MNLISIIILFACIAVSEQRGLMRGECMVQPNRRIECGHSGITKFRCLAQHCCYDNSILGAISCFESKATVTPLGQAPPVVTLEILNNQAHDELYSPQPHSNNPDKSTVRTCSAAPIDRVECGWSSISRQSCEARGCCFDRSVRGVPWCFQADSLLISRKMKAVLECAWECSRKSWRKIAAGYTKCGTNVVCWMTLVGQTPGSCVSACKTTYEIDVFKSNVSVCLGLGRDTARSASTECDTDLPCWIDRFGHRALHCFRLYQVTGQSFVVEIPSTEEPSLPQEELELPLTSSRPTPIIEREEITREEPEIEPEEPEDGDPPPPPEEEHRRTNLNVEISSGGQTENRSVGNDAPPPEEQEERIPEERIEEENSG
ncbi:uncharacterized protein LOC100178289 [Ciona intestinalis]